MENKTTLRPDMAYSIAARHHISPKEAHDLVELGHKYGLTVEELLNIKRDLDGIGSEEEA